MSGEVRCTNYYDCLRFLPEVDMVKDNEERPFCSNTCLVSWRLEHDMSQLFDMHESEAQT